MGELYELCGNLSFNSSSSAEFAVSLTKLYLTKSFSGDTFPERPKLTTVSLSLSIETDVHNTFPARFGLRGGKNFPTSGGK